MTKKMESTADWKPEGVFAATLTPMNADLSVNHALLIDHCKWLLAHGVNGIAVSGTTGEANSLSVAEKMIMLDALIAGGIPANKLIVGTGCCAFPDAVALTRHALNHCVAGTLMLPPFYYKDVSDNGVFASYNEVIQRVGNESLRIYLYHFPKMGAVPLGLDLIQRLLARYPDQIAGIKDSSGDLSNMKAMVDTFPDFRVFAGTEAFLLDILRAGGVGCISASVNLTGFLAGRVFDHWQEEEADALQSHLTTIRHMLQEHPFIPMLKGLMTRYTEYADWQYMRPPHVLSSQNEIERLEALLSDHNFNPVMTEQPAS